MAKVLFFFTSSYPYGEGESFIETEIQYLAKAFDKIILISNNTKAHQTRKVPKNIVLLKYPYELNLTSKIFALGNFGNMLFWDEIKVILRIYRKRITLPIINTILQSMQKAKKTTRFIKQLVNKYTHNNDEVFLYSYWNNDMAFAIAYFKSKHNNIKSFSRMHGWDVYFEANKINYLPFRKYIFENLNAVFSISGKAKRYYCSLFPELNDKIHVSKLGVKHRGLNPINKSDILYILSNSGMVPIKNLDLLIESLSKLKIDYFWYHIGSGPLYERLNKQAAAHINNRYKFLGNISNKNLYSFLEKTPIDLFINVSISEGIPVSIMEAMSFGIPCMATAVGGTPEIVNDSNGVLLNSNVNAIEIVSKIEEFEAMTPEHKTIKRKAAFATWNEKYKAETNYNSFINEILNQ
jgi:glycosyltransferase involved in cell wall biosynthesis